MYDRMKRWYERVVNSSGRPEVDVDNAYVFLLFCYHLKDWIKNDVSIDKQVRGAVENFVNTTCIALAGDVANGVKHLIRDRQEHVRVDPAARVSASYSPTWALGESPLGVTLVIVGDQIRYDARDVAGQCAAAWDEFLKRHGLPS